MLDTLINVVAPIFMVMALGALYGRRFRPDTKTFSSAIIYLFAPALIIDGFYTVQLEAEALAQITALIVLTAVLMAVIGYLLAALLRLDARATNALVLTVILFNGANYGTPFNTFAYGIEAERIAIIYYSVAVVVVNTLGVYIASRGSGVMSVREALMNILRTPLFYAAIVGLTINIGNITLPLTLARSINILGAAMIPTMLILIGIQFSHFRFNAARLRPVLAATFAILIIAPLIAWALSLALNMEGLAQKVGITQHAMPTAVMAVALTTQFDGDVEQVTTTLLFSTAISALTLSVLVSIIG